MNIEIEMVKFSKFFIVCFAVLVCFNGISAVKINKKSSVSTTKKESIVSDVTGSSLVPGVVGLVSSVMDINAKQKSMTANCLPSGSEINFINSMIKEYAKSGGSRNILLAGHNTCSEKESYASSIKLLSSSKIPECYEVFNLSDNTNIWNNYPMATTATMCPNGDIVCAGKEIKVTNAYDLFAVISYFFSTEDYTESEAIQVAGLLKKTEECSKDSLDRRKKELWGNFITNTAGNIGKNTNTGSIIQQVGSMSGSGVGGIFNSIAPIATQFMDK